MMQDAWVRIIEFKDKLGEMYVHRLLKLEPELQDILKPLDLSKIGDEFFEIMDTVRLRHTSGFSRDCTAGDSPVHPSSGDQFARPQGLPLARGSASDQEHGRPQLVRQPPRHLLPIGSWTHHSISPMYRV